MGYEFLPHISPTHPHCTVQDVSDRVEKEPAEGALVAALEAGSRAVVRTNWRMHISLPLQMGKRRWPHAVLMREYAGNGTFQVSEGPAAKRWRR